METLIESNIYYFAIDFEQKIGEAAILAPIFKFE